MVRCKGCGTKIYAEEGWVKIGEDFYHPECVNYFQCENCGDFFYYEDRPDLDEDLCWDCNEKYYIKIGG